MISVIVPVYQVEKYLNECLDSLVKQDIKERYEILLIDFGSTDSSSKICHEYAFKYPNLVTWIKKDENYGVSASRNVGISLANGKYVTFIDSDDFVRKDYLSSLFSYAKDDKYEIITGGYYLYKKKKRPGYSRTSYQGEGISCLKKLYQSPFLKFRTFCWGRLIRLSLLRDNHIRFDDDLNQYEDWPFIFKCLYFAKKAIYFKKPIYYYRQRTDSVMKGTSDFVTPHIEVLRRTKEFLAPRDEKSTRILFDKPHFAIKSQIRFDCHESAKKLDTSSSLLYKKAKKELISVFDQNKVLKGE
mgnify:CR=1 FL=1